MTWGGLRGAVGLALAIQVNIEKAAGKISELNADRVLFYTGGVAFLTLCINAVTCPALVKYLGLVQMDDVKKNLLQKVCGQMISRVKLEDLKGPVRRALEEMLEASEHSMGLAYSMRMHLDTPTNGDGKSDLNDKMMSPTYESNLQTHMENEEAETEKEEFVKRRRSVSSLIQSTASEKVLGLNERIREYLSAPEADYESGKTLVHRFNEVLGKIDTVPPEVFDLMNIPPPDDLAMDKRLLDKIRTGFPDTQTMQLINASLLSLTQAEYWHMIDEGEFIKGSSHPELLLNSITWASQSKSARLADYDFLVKEVGLQVREKPKALDGSRSTIAREDHILAPNEDSGTYTQAVELSAVIAEGHQEEEELSRLGEFVTSTGFQVGITIVIIVNVVNVLIEENNMKDKEGDSYNVWLGVEIGFNTIFTIEFLLKLCAFGHLYFYDAWNCFDFGLVISGLFGVIVEIVSGSDDTNLSSEARVFRVNKLFRALRLLRVFRLVQLLSVLRAKWSGMEVSLHLAKNMRIISILTAFARAHHKAENKLKKFFGEPMNFEGCELARCIIDSRISTCNAIAAAAFEMGKMELVILERLAALRESGQITEELSHFIHEAGHMGVMNPKEAEHMLKPLREQQQKWMDEEKHHLAGMYDRDQAAAFASESQFRRVSRRVSGSASCNTNGFSHRSSLRAEMAFVENPFDLRRTSEAQARDSHRAAPNTNIPEDDENFLGNLHD
jgi:hypothetical protein